MKKLFEKWTDNQNIEKRRELLTAVSFNKWYLKNTSRINFSAKPIRVLLTLSFETFVSITRNSGEGSISQRFR